MLKSELLQLIANLENSGVEFKRDDVRPEQLAREIVALANLKGGHVLLGVEDDGSISGLHPAHSDLKRLERLICHYTRPHFHVQVHPLLVDGLVIAQVQVPLSPVPIATHDGVYRRRQLQNGNGEPECVRFRPARQARRASVSEWPDNGSETPARSDAAENHCVADDPSPDP